MVIYVEEEDVTPWFNTAADNDDLSRDKVSVTRKSATSVDVSFSSGTYAFEFVKKGCVSKYKNKCIVDNIIHVHCNVFCGLCEY